MTKNLINFPLDKSHERNKKKEQLKYSQENSTIKWYQNGLGGFPT